MHAEAKRLILNLLGNQGVWFIAVIAAGRGQAWPGVLAAFAFIALHLRSASRPADEIRLVLLAMLCGWVIDGVAAWQGWVAYRAATFGSAMAPPWILALWASLAVTAHTGMRSLQPYPWAAAVLGGVGGPLAYFAAARGWDAAEFPAPAWRGWVWLAVAWAIALPLLLGVARRQVTRSALR